MKKEERKKQQEGRREISERGAPAKTAACFLFTDFFKVW